MILLNEIESGLRATCRNCLQTTFYTGKVRVKIEKDGQRLLKYQREFQCQDCGELKIEDPDNELLVDWLIERCECGGEFRRDKPIFCKYCKANKTELNKSEPKIE